tara:strand:- start:380 stop:574 length:195 start_codon:yes stop_codon:yes gene_type:complete
MITRRAGFYSIDGSAIAVSEGLQVSLSESKQLIEYASEAEFLDAFPEYGVYKFEEDSLSIMNII